MRNVTIKGLLAHKLRLALTSLAIVLGVTFISGSFVLTDTLHSLFDGLVGNVYHKIDFEVRGVAQFPTSDAASAVRNPLPATRASKALSGRSQGTPSSSPTRAPRSRTGGHQPSASISTRTNRSLSSALSRGKPRRAPTRL
jgi:hypothetical protein